MTFPFLAIDASGRKCSEILAPDLATAKRYFKHLGNLRVLSRLEYEAEKETAQKLAKATARQMAMREERSRRKS